MQAVQLVGDKDVEREHDKDKEDGTPEMLGEDCGDAAGSGDVRWTLAVRPAMQQQTAEGAGGSRDVPETNQTMERYAWM